MCPVEELITTATNFSFFISLFDRLVMILFAILPFGVYLYIRDLIDDICAADDGPPFFSFQGELDRQREQKRMITLIFFR